MLLVGERTARGDDVGQLLPIAGLGRTDLHACGRELGPRLGGFLLPAWAAAELEHRDDVTRTLIPHVTCSHVFTAAFHAHASRLPSVVRKIAPSSRYGAATIAASSPAVITYSTGTLRAASSSAVRREILASRSARAAGVAYRERV